MRRIAGDRDRAWLEQLFDVHSRQLRAFAVRRVGLDAADDVVSEVFATAWRRRSDVPEPALAWLFQTARHIVLHQVRSASRRVALHATVRNQRQPAAAPSAEDAARVLIEAVLDELPATEAEILRLTVWDQLTPSEIAVALSITPGATRTRLMRARQHAQEIYEATLLADVADPTMSAERSASQP
ncbi:MAG TPA: RNA polymerase sigma factor [Micropruina sp.]|nr:RNA polymerase sigma factor [Micropruina sp.]